jgi:type I restriction enzyme R subunit
LLDGTQALLDSVIVVTDRVNLDTQIRNNIVAFKRLQNLVAWADSAVLLQKKREISPFSRIFFVPLQYI